jgi:integrase
MELNRKNKIKFNDITILWLKSKKNIKVQSYQKYEKIINNYIKDSIGNIPINTLTKDNIIDFFNNIKENEIALSTQKTLLYIVKASLEYAYNNNYSNYIDLKDIKLKTLPKTIYVFSKEQQQTLENKLKEKMNIRKLCLLLCLYTGLRIGEICGLKWENINFNTNSLEIKRTIQRIKDTSSTNSKTKLIESTPKSLTSNRIVSIPAFIMEYLKKFKSNDDYYILSNSNKLYDPRQFEEFYKRILKKCNINYMNFHRIRHTYATRCIESKMDIKTLSEILGHSSVEITLKLYVHPSYELKKSSVENLVKFMGNY